MTAHIEKFEIPGIIFMGIEDYKDGEPDSEHFFPNYFRKGERERFQCWVGGCGVGQTMTLADARRKLHDYARSDLERKRAKLLKDLAVIEASLSKLTTPKAASRIGRLLQFKVPCYDHERPEALAKALTA